MILIPRFQYDIYNKKISVRNPYHIPDIRFQTDIFVFMSIRSLVLHNTCTVTDITCRDADTRVTCVYNTGHRDAKRYVIYMTVSCIEDQVAGSRLRYADLSSDTGLGTGSTR